jgi:hypothetical protein
LELVAFNQQTAAATCPRSKRFGMTANGLAASERLASFVAAWNAAGFRTHLFGFLIVHAAAQRRHVAALHAAAFDLHDELAAFVLKFSPALRKFHESMVRVRLGTISVRAIRRGRRGVDHWKCCRD